jgi:hypothetical protein
MTDWFSVCGGIRAALAIVAHARRKALRTRVAELMAVAMVCERRRVADLRALDAEHKLAALRSYPAM